MLACENFKIQFQIQILNLKNKIYHKMQNKVSYSNSKVHKSNL